MADNETRNGLDPEYLAKLAKRLGEAGIDISALVEVVNYLDDPAVRAALETADLSRLDGKISSELLVRLVPLLSADSISMIFEKILTGKLDYHLIAIILPYAEYLREPIEAAVVDGALDSGALEILRQQPQRGPAGRVR